LIVAKGLHQFVKPMNHPQKNLAFCALEVKSAAAAEPAPNLFFTACY